MTGPAPPAFEEIVDTFDLLDDWEERYRYLIDLGRELPPLAAAERSDANRVDGCVSQVWLVPRIECRGGVRCLRFEGDSDAHITRGLVAVLRALYSGRSLAEIPAVDAAASLGRLDLASHISRQRSNGLQSMVKRIRAIARAAATGDGK